MLEYALCNLGDVCRPIIQVGGIGLMRGRTAQSTLSWNVIRAVDLTDLGRLPLQRCARLLHCNGVIACGGYALLQDSTRFAIDLARICSIR